MEDNSLIKKDIELNYLMLDMFHDRILWRRLIHVKNTLLTYHTRGKGGYNETYKVKFNGPYKNNC